MHDILRWCVDHWSITAFALAGIIQITPIFKANPLTALFSWLGKILNGDVLRQIEELKATITEQRTDIDENEKDRIRFEVLDFANSCRNGRKHTKDEFEHIIVLNEKYKRLLAKTGDTNGVFAAEYEYIFELYRMCQRENKFL